jgi:FAD/FMN-containing dehydrogenase
VAVELLANSRNESNPASDSHTAQLYVGFEGTSAEVDWLTAQLRSEWAAAGVAAPITISDASVHPLWSSLNGAEADIEIRVLPGGVAGLVGNLLETAPPCSIRAHAGDGLIGVALWNGMADCKGDSPIFADAKIGTVPLAQLRALAAAHGGTMTVLKHPNGPALSAAEIWGPTGPEIRIMQAIKERFDPHNILNPGRSIFG